MTSVSASHAKLEKFEIALTLLAAAAAFFLGTKLSESESTTALFLGAAFFAAGFTGLASLSDWMTAFFLAAGLAAGSGIR